MILEVAQTIGILGAFLLISYLIVKEDSLPFLKTTKKATKNYIKSFTQSSASITSPTKRKQTQDIIDTITGDGKAR